MTIFNLKEHLKQWFYTETEQDTLESEVKESIDNFIGLNYIAVDSLPESPKTSAIYIIPNSTGGSDYYLYTNGAWEIIGASKLDLTPYLLSTDFEALKTEIEEHNHNNTYYTKTWMDSQYLTVTSVELSLMEYQRDGVRLNIQVTCNDDSTVPVPSGLPITISVPGNSGVLGDYSNLFDTVVYTDDSGFCEYVLAYEDFQTTSKVDKTVYATCKNKNSNYITLPTVYYVKEETVTEETVLTATNTTAEEGLSWDTAFTSLDSLIDLPDDGDVVFIASGTYLVSNNVINMPLVSIFGAEDHYTFINSDKSGMNSIVLTATDDYVSSAIHNLEYLGFDTNLTTTNGDYFKVYPKTCNIHVYRCAFRNSYKAYNGGSLQVKGTLKGKVIIEDCYLCNQRTTGYGHSGASCQIIADTVTYLRVHHCTFDNPTSSSNVYQGTKGRAIGIYNWNGSVSKVDVQAYCNSYLGEGDTNYNITESDCTTEDTGCTWI